MTRGSLARAGAERLRTAAWVEDPRLEAEILLAWVLGVKRLELALEPGKPVSEAAAAAFAEAITRRLAGEPVQYITGEAAFREIELRVDRRVLIPRPETEILVGEVLKWAGARAEASGRRLTAADIGTGSGAIALSLLKEGPFERVVATDVSAEALEVARENAARLGLEAGLDLRQGALFAPLRGERFDVVVSNPPYVADADRSVLPPDVRDWEPAGALFAGPTGLEVLAALIEGAPRHIEPGGLLALEIGAGQAEEVAWRIGRRGAYGPPRIVPDLGGVERVVLAERRGSC
ncbi:MAG TPA: peptide chain release factor N(5)-glutamine methyltransferase [Longimicrobiales bacterium]